ncbi:hypothetical protein MexAM1_META1p3185 [Methylorubrum extorquens AM1]|uniref:Uncharacterized protein n=2 Tax=Methylorubrum extorquens TaxID=408 RepID=C5AWS7_METEA|nr:hypothetical protein MexAM1_META1p3185 [Methylorubrum extorquens AM1]
MRASAGILRTLAALITPNRAVVRALSGG